MGRRLQVVAVALLFGGIAVRAGAQSSTQVPAVSAASSSKIATINVTGTKKFAPDQIIAVSGLKAGDIVTTEQLQAAANRLAALGLFSTVNYRFTSRLDTIALEFQVQDAPTFPVSFDNFPWFTDDEIAQAIRKEVGMFTGEAPAGGTMVDGINIAIEDLLDSKKIKGALTHQLLARAVDDGMTLQFRLDGSPLRIQSVKFGDAMATDSERLKDRISDIRGQPYSRFAIEVFENEHIRPIYLSKGYARVRIGPSDAKLTVDVDIPTQAALDVAIPITPGSVYTWGGATWQGNVAIPSANLDGSVPLKIGDPVDGMKIEALWQQIEQAYASHGYLDAKVNAQEQFDDAAHKVSYRVSIAEGVQYRMGEMVVTGLSLDAEKRLRQAWRIVPGQIFDDGYFESLSKELVKPSAEIFGEMPIHYTEFGHWLRPDPVKHTVDVLLDFK